MNTLQAYIAAHNQGIDLIAQCANMSEHDLQAMGLRPEPAQQLAKLASIYFGECLYRGRRGKAIAGARAHHHDLTTITTIERWVQKTKNPTHAWQLRQELCNTPAADIPTTAKTRLAKLYPKKKITENVRVTRRRNKSWTISITGNSATVGELASIIDKKKPIQSVEKLLAGTSGRPQLHTNVIITLGQLDTIVHGGEAHNSPADIIVRLSNGATMTGAELVTRTLADQGYVTLVHPETGPVNLYRTSRFANSKQRIMLQALHHTCAWPDCTHPIDECQFHHVKAWKDGGETNVDNLVPLCPYHNGVNNDAGPVTRGRMVRIQGRTAWVPPWDGAPRFTSGFAE